MSPEIFFFVALAIISIKFISGERIHARKAPTIFRFGDHNRIETTSKPILDINDAAKEPSTRTLSHSSGQLIRLRHGSSYNEGIVEVFQDNSWGFICEDSVDKSAADVICKELGFSRGSLEKYTLSVLPVESIIPNFWLTEINCTRNEPSITHCFFKKRMSCRTSDNAVGITCRPNRFAVCEIDEVPFNGKCYKFITTPKNYSDARQTCLLENGRLAIIDSQYINNFLSEYLSFKNEYLTWFTGGKRVRYTWRWHEVEEPNEISHFTNWFPGWNGWEGTARPKLQRFNHCLALQNLFPDIFGKEKLINYYYWNNVHCDQELPFICEKAEKDIGCVFGNGTNYRGTASISQNGYPCTSWNQPRLHGIIVNQYKDEDLGDHPYCRNPDHNTQPWCLINALQYDLCDIPDCPEPATLESRFVLANTFLTKPDMITDRDASNSKKPCRTNEFRCNSGQCIPNAWLCDDETDCLDRSDEENCKDVMKAFAVVNGKKLQAREVEKWMHTTLSTCARKCFYSKSFDCQSFMFRNGYNECILTNSNRGTASLKVDPRYDFFELLTLLLGSSCPKGQVQCDNGKCVDDIKLCNEIENCKDDDNCPKEPKFDIRLADGDLKHEGKLYNGRVEVYMDSEWGVICDDSWDIDDANVVCKQLGFHLGALKPMFRSYYGTGNGNILMDEIQCKGTEKSLFDCKFLNRKNHDCTKQETAGVICRIPIDVCPKDQWLCNNSKCIQANYLCDKDDDCKDGSDEDEKRCSSPLNIRLSDGPNDASGRVEIQRFGIWGTVCDDMWDDNDAKVICRMLGHKGEAKAHKQGHFKQGTGIIWLDNVNCKGDEKSIENCEKELWSKNNCEHKEDAGVTCASTSKVSTTLSPNWEFIPKPKTTTISPDVSSKTMSCGNRFFETKTTNLLDKPARIIGGFNAIHGAYPWQVGIRLKFGKRLSLHYCGGTIIGEFHVISAAHCFEKHKKEEYLIRVGDLNQDIKDQGEQEFEIKELFIHHDYDKGGDLNNDIILIKIQAKNGTGIQFNDYVQPACLPDPRLPNPEHQMCHVSGWGSLNFKYGQADSESPRILQATTVPILPLSWCKARTVYSYKITEAMFCAGYLEGGIDSCKGDSGGPLVCAIDNKFTLLGVISWGQGCALPNKPGVYTRVSHFREWIEWKQNL